MSCLFGHLWEFLEWSYAGYGIYECKRCHKKSYS